MPIKTPICDFGQTAKNFELKSTDNEAINLNDIKGENGTLIMFICNHCPFVKAIALISDFFYFSFLNCSIYYRNNILLVCSRC